MEYFHVHRLVFTEIKLDLDMGTCINCIKHTFWGGDVNGVVLTVVEAHSATARRNYNINANF